MAGDGHLDGYAAFRAVCAYRTDGDREQRLGNAELDSSERRDFLQRLPRHDYRWRERDRDCYQHYLRFLLRYRSHQWHEVLLQGRGCELRGNQRPVRRGFGDTAGWRRVAAGECVRDTV